MTSVARLALILVLAPALLARCSSTTADLAPLQWQKVAGSGPNGSVLGFGLMQSAGAYAQDATQDQTTPPGKPAVSTDGGQGN